MPKDPAGARPSGALVRHAADWFSDSLYCGGWIRPDKTPSGTEDFLAVSLLNQDSAGRVAKIYGYSTANDGGSGVLINFTSGPTGSLIGAAPNVRPDLAVSGVQVFANLVNQPFPGTYPFSFGAQAGLLGNSGFDSQTMMSPFPMFIIPAGVCLVGSNLSGTFQPGIFFWFQMANR